LMSCVNGHSIWVGTYDSTVTGLEFYNSEYEFEYVHADTLRRYFYATHHEQRIIKISNYTLAGISSQYFANVYHYGTFTDSVSNLNNIYLISADSVTKVRTERKDNRVTINVVGVLRMPGQVVCTSIDKAQNYGYLGKKVFLKVLTM
jgi:hypothetical protein